MRVGSCYVGVVVVVVSCDGGCKVKRFKRKWQNIYYPLCARGTSNESFSNCLAVCYQLSNPPVFGTTWKDLGDVIIERQEWMCSTLCCTWIVRFCWGEAEGHIQRMAKPFLGCSHLLGDANFHLIYEMVVSWSGNTLPDLFKRNWCTYSSRRLWVHFHLADREFY